MEINKDVREEARRRISRWPNARVAWRGAAVLVDKIPGDENTR